MTSERRRTASCMSLLRCISVWISRVTGTSPSCCSASTGSDDKIEGERLTEMPFGGKKQTNIFLITGEG